MPQATANEPPFARGEYQALDSGVAVANQPFASLLGQEWEFDDVDWTNATPGVKPLRTGGKVRCRLVRNEKGGAITPKQLCKIDPTNPGLVSGLTTAVTNEGYPADEFLPSAGVPDDGIFWVVVRGQAKVVLAAAVLEDVVAGDYLVPSGVTAGTVNVFDYTAVPTTATPFESAWNALKNARFKATAAATAVSSGGATITVEVMN